MSADSLIHRLWSRLKRTPSEPEPYSTANLPAIGEDARTYVAHGNNLWGNSISFDTRGDHELSVYGWLSRAPFPLTGDKLLVRCASGKWGVYVFGEVKRAHDPPDMFTGEAFGPVGYADQEPQHKTPDEFITDLSEFFL